MPVMIEARVSRFDLITPTAEKQIEQLQPRDKSKVINTLEKPIRLDRCKKLAKEKNVPLWRARVTDDIRITFCRVGDKICVVHVGAHAVADHFIDRVNSPLSLNPKPLKESLVMKKTAVVSTTRSQETPNYVSGGSNANGWHDLMERGIKTLIDGHMVDELEVMRELATDQIKDVRDEVNGQAEAITKLSTRVNDLVSGVEQAKAEQVKLATELTRIGISQRDDTKRQGEDLARSMAKTTQEQDRRVTDLGQKLVHVTELTDERLSALSHAAGIQEQRTTRLGEGLAQVKEQLAQADKVTQELVSRIDKMQAVVTGMGKTLTMFAEEHEVTATKLQELKASIDEAASRSWAARWKRWSRTFRVMFAKATGTTNDSEQVPA